MSQKDDRALANLVCHT